jgi:hypothetical protein
MNEIDDIAVVSEATSAADAFDRLRGSRRSVLLVQGAHGEQLFSAESLHAAAEQAPELSVRAATQRTGAPDLLAPHAELLGVQGDQAHIRVATSSLFDVMNLSVGIHTCSGKPIHSYYDWQLKNLAKDSSGNYICDFDPTIVS